MLNFAFMNYVDAGETCWRLLLRLPDDKGSTGMFFFPETINLPMIRRTITNIWKQFTFAVKRNRKKLTLLVMECDQLRFTPALYLSTILRYYA